MLTKINISGYRGFEDEQTLEIAVPNGKKGSGLTIIVGPNNSGKSTIYESFKAISSPIYNGPSFTEGKRNKNTGSKISITIFDENGQSLKLKTVDSGGSETIFDESGRLLKSKVNIYALPSRRNFNPFFSKYSIQERSQYINNQTLPSLRAQGIDNFFQRIFKIQADQEKFNNVIHKIMPNLPSWNIEQNDQGSYYIRFNIGKNNHNSDGVGEGIMSLFTIVDALYDSEDSTTDTSKDNLIYIDEPELSLHPSLQKKLVSLLCEYAKDRQIIYSTHSPYFINWEALVNGAKLARTCKYENKCEIYQLSRENIDKMEPLLQNLNNPHIFGLNSNEVFFLEDNIILVEGQEDVIFYNRILELLQINLPASFYGWGVGGASNMPKILAILKDLGFKNVFIILDNNVPDIKKQCEEKFPEYKTYAIPADDVRDKPARSVRKPISGLIDEGGKEIKKEYKEQIKGIFEEIISKIAKHNEEKN